MREGDNDKRRRGWPQLIRGNDISCSLGCGIGGMRNYPKHLGLIASKGIKERTPRQDSSLLQEASQPDLLLTTGYRYSVANSLCVFNTLIVGY